MQQVQWELFYFEFTKTEDFDRTKRGYLVLVQYCDVKEDFKSNENRPIWESKTDQGSSLEFQKFQSLELYGPPSRTVRPGSHSGEVHGSVPTNDFIPSRLVDLNRLEVLDYEEFYKWFSSSLANEDYEKFNLDYDWMSWGLSGLRRILSDFGKDFWDWKRFRRICNHGMCFKSNISLSSTK